MGLAAAAAPAVTVSGAWSRPALAGMSVGVVYLTVANHGRTPDRLVGASTPVAAMAELHRSSVANGVSSMTPAPGGLAVPAGGTVRLEPNGYHLMLMGLKQGLKPGARFPATLQFAHAGKLQVQVQVRSAAP